MQSAIIAILAAGLAGWVFGTVWYTSLGKPWHGHTASIPKTARTRKCR